VRFTDAPSPSRAMSMNSGVTPIAPQDTIRRRSTCRRYPGTSMSDRKTVGGPIMKLAP
jgi:hypothetical protein